MLVIKTMDQVYIINLYNTSSIQKTAIITFWEIKQIRVQPHYKKKSEWIKI